VIYRNDFEKSVTGEWSVDARETTPKGENRFLGPFCNEELSLSLDSLSHHRFLRLSLDLYTARSWDGNHPDFGPDLVTIRVAGGPTLLHTSFAYGPQRQSFPDSYPYGDHKADTGSTSTRTLGYTFREAPADAVYRLRFVVPHRASAVTFQFSAGGLSTAPTDEFWGLDNVAVEALGAARELRPADAERLWADLEGGDPGRINPAIAEWVLAGEARIAFLRNKLAATRDARRRAKRLFAKLDAKRFEAFRSVAKGPERGRRLAHIGKPPVLVTREFKVVAILKRGLPAYMPDWRRRLLPHQSSASVSHSAVAIIYEAPFRRTACLIETVLAGVFCPVINIVVTTIYDIRI